MEQCSHSFQGRKQYERFKGHAKESTLTRKAFMQPSKMMTFSEEVKEAKKGILPTVVRKRKMEKNNMAGGDTPKQPEPIAVSFDPQGKELIWETGFPRKGRSSR